MDAAVEGWQNRRDQGAKAAYVAAVELRPVADLSRGMVIAGRSAAEVAAAFTGAVHLDYVSFTGRDWIADAFARMDEPVGADEVRVKVFLAEGLAALVHQQGDPTYDFEAEWLVAGDFAAAATVEGDQLVVVTLTAA